MMRFWRTTLSSREIIRRVAFVLMLFFAMAWVVASWWPGKYALGPMVMSMRSPRHSAIYFGVACAVWILLWDGIYRRVRRHG
jgi:hypothetical protein